MNHPFKVYDLFVLDEPADTFAVEVEWGRTNLLQIINAALNDELFFAIACHKMTVVEIDAIYTKPFTTNSILIAPRPDHKCYC